MAEAVASAQLPELTKATLLADLALHGSWLEERIVLGLLPRLDTEQVVNLLIRLFDTLPADAKEVEPAIHGESLPGLVLALDHDPLTRSYLQEAKRNMHVRMALLGRLAYQHSRNSHVAQLPVRVALLTAFLDDDMSIDRSRTSEASLADDFPEHETPSGRSGSTDGLDDFPDMTVRDFAAMHIAKLLEMHVNPCREWMPEQWSTLRQRVRERLKKEELPELE
jgi:hypothetical protein